MVLRFFGLAGTIQGILETDLPWRPSSPVLLEDGTTPRPRTKAEILQAWIDFLQGWSMVITGARIKGLSLQFLTTRL